MGKPACCEKNGLKKGPWTAEEDQKLLHYIHNHGYQKWRTVPKNAGLQRCGKSCRLRWTNYLRPDIKRGKFSLQEEGTIIQLHSVLGNKWSTIASSLPGRTDNEIKNYWNTNLRKKLMKQGIDPVTHRPLLDLLQLFSLPTSSSSLYNSPQQLNIQNLSQIQNTLNIPNFLDLVPSLASFQSKNLQNYPKNLQHNHFRDSQVQCEEFQAWTTSIDSNASLFGNNRNALLMQPSMEQFSNALPNFSDTYNGYRAIYMGQSAVSPPGVINCINMDPTLGELLSADQNKMFESNDNATNFELGSVMLTPSCSKSPLNSSRTHVNGSHEDHEDSHCSNVLLDLPAGFYFDGFM